MTEETIQTEYLYRGQVLKLRLDQVRLRDKKIVAREIVEHQGAVAIVALDENQCVLLVRQYRSAAAREMLEIPAGTLEDGEDPLPCAMRELREETGYRARQWEALGSFYSSPGYSTEKIHLFLARHLDPGMPDPEDDEAISIELVPFDLALEKIERGEIMDAKTMIGLLYVRKILSHK